MKGNNMNEKPNTLVINDGRAEVGTPKDLYEAIKDETIEYLANNDRPCLYDVTCNCEILRDLEEIIDKNETEDIHGDVLYMVTWSHNNVPTLYRLYAEEE